MKLLAVDSFVLPTMRLKVLKMKAYLMHFIPIWRFTNNEWINHSVVVVNMFYVWFNDCTNCGTNSRPIFKEVMVIWLYSQISSNVMLGLDVLRIPFQGWLERCVEGWEESGKSLFWSLVFWLNIFTQFYRVSNGSHSCVKL